MDTLRTINSISCGHSINTSSMDVHIGSQVCWQHAAHVHIRAVVETRVWPQKDMPKCSINLTRTFRLNRNRQSPTSKPLLTPTSVRIKRSRQLTSLYVSGTSCSPIHNSLWLATAQSLRPLPPAEGHLQNKGLSVGDRMEREGSLGCITKIIGRSGELMGWWKTIRPTAASVWK